jgi:inner membrane protein involved in colicin E2 resistance
MILLTVRALAGKTRLMEASLLTAWLLLLVPSALVKHTVVDRAQCTAPTATASAAALPGSPLVGSNTRV